MLFLEGQKSNFVKEKEQQKLTRKYLNANLCTRITQKQELMYKLQKEMNP